MQYSVVPFDVLDPQFVDEAEAPPQGYGPCADLELLGLVRELPVSDGPDLGAPKC